MSEGAGLPDAVKAMDASGEFEWRLRNALQSGPKFLRALAGWHAALDAKAFQREQAASQVIMSAVVLWNGFFVGTLAAGVFLVLVNIIDQGVLW